MDSLDSVVEEKAKMLLTICFSSFPAICFQISSKIPLGCDQNIRKQCSKGLILIPSPNNNFLERTKLKAFAEDNLNIAFLVKNIVKRRKC